MMINGYRFIQNNNSLNDIYWVPKPFIGYFKMALHVGIAFHIRVPKSSMDYFKMNLHVGIASRFWFSFKGTQTTYLLF